jgi:hypothetical protein
MQPPSKEDNVTTERVKELLSDLLQMRKRLKREEESRRQFQEVARKKDEELRRVKAEVAGLEKRLQEEEAAKGREKAVIGQRDNRIKVFEDKVK